MVEEMEKLRQKLDEINIAWWDESDFIIDRTKFEINGNRWSVVNGEGTYGGIQYGSRINKGLLEVRPNEHAEPIGWVTCEDVIEMIRRQREADSTKATRKMR